MAELGFLLKADKSAIIKKDKSNINFKTDLIAYLTYTRNNSSYLAVADHFKNDGLKEEEVELIIYRLRLRNNETQVLFHKAVEDSGLRNLPFTALSLADKYIYYGACQMLGQNIDHDFARKRFHSALELDDKAVLAYANLGSLAVMAENKNEALEWFNKALEITPDHAQVLANKLELIVSMPDTTIRNFEQTVQALLSNDPMHPIALNYGIQLAIFKGIPFTALSYLKVYYPNYYLEADTLKLMEKVFSALSITVAHQAYLDIRKASKGPLARKVLSTFYKYYFEVKYVSAETR
jgi:tetratricopeptide (TPR) repeat protein